MVVGDPVPLLASRGTVLDLTRNRRLGISLRQTLALVLRADLVIGGDSGFVVAPWLAGRRVISLVPGRYVRRGYRIDMAGQTLLATVDRWLPPASGWEDRQIVLPLETTSRAQVVDIIGRMGLLDGPRATKSLPNPVRARRPHPLGLDALLRHALPDLLGPLARVFGPSLLRLRSKLRGRERRQRTGRGTAPAMPP